MTTTTVYRSGNIGTCSNALVGGVADFLGVSMAQAQKTCEQKFDEIMARDYPGVYASWYPYTSEVIGDYSADYDNVDFDEVFQGVSDELCRS